MQRAWHTEDIQWMIINIVYMLCEFKLGSDDWQRLGFYPLFKAINIKA